MRKAGLGLSLAIIALSGASIPQQDSRNTSIPDMDAHFRMPVFLTREAWLQKAAFLRMQILASAGLLPMPEKTPLHAEIFGKLERGTYTVEKVLLKHIRASTSVAIYTGLSAKKGRFRQSLHPMVTGHTAAWRTLARSQFQLAVSTWRGRDLWCLVMTWSAITTPISSHMAIAGRTWEARARTYGVSTRWGCSCGTAFAQSTSSVRYRKWIPVESQRQAHRAEGRRLSC
jgi:hypothetical protein